MREVQHYFHSISRKSAYACASVTGAKTILSANLPGMPKALISRPATIGPRISPTSDVLSRIAIVRASLLVASRNLRQ